MAKRSVIAGTQQLSFAKARDVDTFWRWNGKIDVLCPRRWNVFGTRCGETFGSGDNAMARLRDDRTFVKTWTF